MNDDELDKIFELDEETESDDTASDVVSDDKDTSGVSADDFISDDGSADNNSSTEDKKSEDEESGNEEKTDSNTDNRKKDGSKGHSDKKNGKVNKNGRSSSGESKKDRAAETEKAMELAEKYIDELREKRKAARLARREAKSRKKEGLPPLNQRSYLNDFPLSFRTTVLSLLAILFLTLIFLVAFHPMFRISRFNIEGNYALTDEEVIEASGLDYHDHFLKLLSFSPSSIEADNPYIRSITISPDFPSGININVVERRKIAYIKYGDGYFAIDSEGTVLEFSSSPSPDAHPLLCGLDIDHVVLGGRVDVSENSRYQKLVIILGAILDADQLTNDSEYSFFESVQEIRMMPNGTFFLTITLPNGSSLQVKLNDIESISDDMNWLVFSIEDGVFNDFPDGALDMTGERPIYNEYGY